MSTFKRKSMFVAVLSGLGAISGTASAVHVNPDGLGQVLIYPYYTVRAAATPAATGQFNTYISVANTTNSAKAVKVRFLEGKNSREVLDFNLFLSANDVWTGAVVPVSTTKGDGAKLITSDKSCTWGVVTAAGIPFSNLQYSGTNADWEDATLDRTNEGYVEMLEMGVITNAALVTAVTHVSGVAPCTSSTLSAADTAGLVGYLSAPTGGLFGGASLINPSTGVDYSYRAVALDDWDATPAGKPSASTSVSPTIADGSVTVSRVFAGTSVKSATWTTGRDSVSAALMRNQVMNEYVLDSGTASATDWVVTFPTKRFYVAKEASATAHTATTGTLFNQNFGTGGSCDDVTLNLYNREEQTTTTTSVGFSPAPAGSPTQLCWESNVITFNATGTSITSQILGSTNAKNITTTFSNGWLNLGLTGNSGTGKDILTPAASQTNGVADATVQSHRGLPVVGLMVQDFVNSLISSYGGDFEHKYTRDIR